MECIRLRVQDVDFEGNPIYVRAAKGGKDRTTILPIFIKDTLKEQIKAVKSAVNLTISLKPKPFSAFNLPDSMPRSGCMMNDQGSTVRVRIRTP